MNTKRALLLSGGGSWGAYGGGTLARLDRDYDVVIGISTGGLLAPFAALKNWNDLKKAYTSVSTHDIFDRCWYKPNPITNDGRINKIAIIITLMLGQKSICTSKVLKKTIGRFFSENDFNKLRELNKEIIVGTQNFAQTPSKIHYFSSFNESYNEFKDWMWCSANFPFFTSLVRKGWHDEYGKFHIGLWSDGGLTDLIGIEQLIDGGYSEIDILLHRTKIVNKYEGGKIVNLLDNVNRGIGAMRYDIEFQYFYKNIKKLNKQGTKVNVYWFNRRLSDNCLMFDKNMMTDWWYEGYDTALNPDRLEVFEPIIK